MTTLPLVTLVQEASRQTEHPRLTKHLAVRVLRTVVEWAEGQGVPDNDDLLIKLRQELRGAVR